MESIIQSKKECWVCHTTHGLHEHHIVYGGTSNRRAMSEKYGLKVYLCALHHNQVHAYPNRGLDLELKQMAQRVYEARIGTRDDWYKDFIKSYL